MLIYEAPLRDMRFVLHELLNVEREFRQLPGYEDVTADDVDAILQEAAKVCEEVIFPTNRVGDEEGCRLENGMVSTPTGFKEAYKALVEGAWISLACDPEYGGQGLPETLNFFIEEMLCSANVAFSLYPGLTHGAYETVRKHAPEEIRKLYLPRLVDGTWTGSMCLTESQSGSDLGLLRTRAEPQPDGTYKITGTKIFITAGEHDLAENIVHLVLARLTDAPPGIRGISMFLVPKFIANEDGAVGRRNHVVCGALEHKMGIRGSSTCVMNFEGATGYLLGERNRGVRTMFTMMNRERLAVGLQGLGLAEVARQSAAAYARERLQGRSASKPTSPDRQAEPIIVHPDVRRMLLTAKALNEGARALAGWVAVHIDLAEKHSDPAAREEAEDLVALLTPVVKAFFTDHGTDACNLCLQVFGGHGYIAETGMEQLVRDARVAQIYEGTNGIQALDLTGRKLFLHDGRLLRRYFAAVDAFVDENKEDHGLREFLAPLAESLQHLKDTTSWIRETSGENPDIPGASSSDYLRLMALVSLAFMWARSARVAREHLNGAEAEFYRAKISTARFYMTRLLPQAGALARSVMSGGDALMELAAEAF